MLQPKSVESNYSESLNLPPPSNPYSRSNPQPHQDHTNDDPSIATTRENSQNDCEHSQQPIRVLVDQVKMSQPTRPPPSLSPSPSPCQSPLSSPNPSSTHSSRPYHLMNDLAALKTSDLSNAIIHLYRGEMSRQQTYRVRLDTCTNWAVSVTAAMTVFSLGQEAIPHYFHVIIGIFVFIFLVMETRRHGYYMAVKNRVRQIEVGFYGRILMGHEFGRSMCGMTQSFGDTILLRDQPDMSLSEVPQFISPFVAEAQQAASSGKDTEETVVPKEFNLKDMKDINKGVNTSHDRPIMPTNLPSPNMPFPPPELRRRSSLIEPFVNDWIHLLYHSLLHPEVNTSLIDSLLIRLRRVYLLLYLGVIASWMIKFHLDVGFREYWWVPLIVAVVYLIIVFLVVYFIPSQRTKLRAEKHIAAMFMIDRKRKLKARMMDGRIDMTEQGKERGIRRRQTKGRTETQPSLNTYPNDNRSYEPLSGDSFHPSNPSPYAPTNYRPATNNNTLRENQHDLSYWAKMSARNTMERESDL